MSSLSYSFTPRGVGNFLILVLTYGGGSSSGVAPTSITFPGVSGGAFSQLAENNSTPVDMIYGGQTVSTSPGTITLNFVSAPTYFGWEVVEISVGGPSEWSVLASAGFTGGGSNSSGTLPALNNTSPYPALLVANTHQSVSTFSPTPANGAFDYWINGSGQKIQTTCKYVLSGITGSVAATWTTNSFTALFDGCEVLIVGVPPSQQIMIL